MLRFKSREELVALLESHSGHCLDNPQEVEALANAIIEYGEHARCYVCEDLAPLKVLRGMRPALMPVCLRHSAEEGAKL